MKQETFRSGTGVGRKLVLIALNFFKAQNKNIFRNVMNLATQHNLHSFTGIEAKPKRTVKCFQMLLIITTKAKDYRVIIRGIHIINTILRNVRCQIGLLRHICITVYFNVICTILLYQSVAYNLHWNFKFRYFTNGNLISLFHFTNGKFAKF